MYNSVFCFLSLSSFYLHLVQSFKTLSWWLKIHTTFLYSVRNMHFNTVSTVIFGLNFAFLVLFGVANVIFHLSSRCRTIWFACVRASRPRTNTNTHRIAFSICKCQTQPISVIILSQRYGKTIRTIHTLCKLKFFVVLIFLSVLMKFNCKIYPVRLQRQNQTKCRQFHNNTKAKLLSTIDWMHARRTK